ncbi:RNB domain-containing ribonuclease [Engelhardtia mirabilis]|uniref:Ribonuclease R n=1 Tax=Engelhardtia mirabilis TaxID=2528011 RepID=A0A518BIX4_9BACT|nr:Ribonuclease R [Planctomycetes bacterium Pla133]QDV01241.1 Ribonuclease R [Planctomycetes bacterium Pla86]
MTDKDGFKSFKDLLRSRGGDAETEGEHADDRGWHLEEQGAEVDPSKLTEGPAPDSDARDRISARPSAFGPMEHGPAVYADPDSEEMQLLHSFRVRTIFLPDVTAEVAALPADPPPSEYAGRVDLRERTIFTIDGDDAKDYDDAIEMVRLANGNLELGVHIADVAHYVRPGTALDDEALARGTSVYLPDQVVPMLPEQLSNGLCSLVPKRDRFAYSVYMEFDKDGARVAKRVHKSVIRSAHRNTYRIVQELLDGVQSAETAEIEFLRPTLELLQSWTKEQQRIRDAKGSLRIQSTEKKFVFDDEHNVKAIVDAPRYFSMALIEETALAANQAVGDLFRERGLPTIYRVHPEKDQDEIDAVTKMLDDFGIRVPKKDRLTGRDIGRLIRAARRKPNAEALIGRIMGLVERAYYEVRDHEDVAEHWGLARKAYLHFTSPIRRYPDLIVHRWLWAIESRGAEAEEELKAEAFVEDLNAMAGHASMQADVADMCETAMDDLKVCQYMEPHIGEKVEAKVLRVSRPGMDVLLTDFNVRGFLPSKAIGDRVRLEGPTITINRGRRVLSFTEGHAVAVKVVDVDFIRLQVMLELDAR